MSVHRDISASCVANGCMKDGIICRGQEAVMDDVGGGWRHLNCAACVPMPPCALCGGSYMGHLRTWTGRHCNPSTEDRYTPQQPEVAKNE